jgi:hypothetical protein
MVATSNPLARLVFPALLGAALAGGGPLPVTRAAEPISAQDARRFRLAGLAHNRNPGRRLCRRAAGLERRDTG